MDGDKPAGRNSVVSINVYKYSIHLTPGLAEVRSTLRS